MWQKYKPYIISIGIALGVGALSAILTRGSMEIYSQINQPALAPPAKIFPIVWIILYTLMGISSAMVYINRSVDPDTAQSALKLYGVNLVFNFLFDKLNHTHDFIEYIYTNHIDLVYYNSGDR